LGDKPPTSLTIGKASKVAPPLPWPNRDAVFRRDAETRAIREDMQRGRTISPPLPEGRVGDSRGAIYTQLEGE
jgi:hypothetical protein